MLTRRDLLARSLQGSTLFALGSVVPGFLASTARAAGKDRDTVLVVVELNGGNDGLNTVIPYKDDHYHKARPTLRFTQDQVLRLNDEVGLHPGLTGLNALHEQGHLAVVQGVGYPNPDRSHFESMDIWQSADPSRKTQSGWLGRATANLQDARGGIPVLHVGKSLPLALQGAPGGTISINNRRSFRLDLGGGSLEQLKARRQLLEELASGAGDDPSASLLSFVQKRQLETLTSIDRLQELLRSQNLQEQYYREGRFYGSRSLPVQLQLVAQMIQQDFGTRIYYVMKDGFDTHSSQAPSHQKLLAEVGDAIAGFFEALRAAGQDKRVRVMTFSEFGRRVDENGSKGTDHGSGSCLFVAGPSVRGGVIGKHPGLAPDDLLDGDLKYHTDFRRVYATLLDHWLGCPSEAVLGARLEPIEQLKA